MQYAAGVEVADHHFEVSDREYGVLVVENEVPDSGNFPIQLVGSAQPHHSLRSGYDIVLAAQRYLAQKSVLVQFEAFIQRPFSPHLHLEVPAHQVQRQPRI